MVGNPELFWQNSAMGKKANVETRKRVPYNKPDLKTTDGKIVFDQIGLYMCQIGVDQFDKGYLDLDDFWAKSQDENIVRYRQQLFEQYPQPFSGRRAYLFKMGFETVQETTPAGIIKKRTLSKMKPVKSKDGTDRFFFQGFICAFHNKELGVAEENVSVGPDGEILREDTGEGFKYMFCGVFTSPEIMTNVIQNIANAFKENPETDVFAFVLSSGISKRPRDDGGNWLSVEADDIFFL